MDELSRIEHSMSILTRRVDDMSLRQARADEREKHVDEKLSGIKRDVEKVHLVMQRVGWLVMAALIAAAMKFVINGGLGQV